ncbi:PilZ domain-containing protein [Paenibacillus sp. LMG 31460]|uniref:PilZ domain-containing protein n=1 Tax=Paenibacillus germinis TaxID=2654979 RepID=A0ABX1Z9C7_9BACL|nr:PilZ domain-containing protein [Paenibacillus germinis]NOU89980.1 PilZ domain-containing protein [Paenibacillus germinis]
MDWNKALELAYIAPNTDCHLIIVGECKDGSPFCYEENFSIDKIGESSFTVCLELSGIFPFDKLEHISFIEFSFKDRGVLYYAYVDLIQLELKKTICYLSLSIPEEIHHHQNRKYSRAKLSLRTPITLRIVGIRGISASKGVAFSGQLLDISASGLSFVTTNRLFFPLFLEFSFILPGYPHPITAYGEIIRVTNFSNDSYRVAAEFRHTPESMLQDIDKYCSITS